MALEATYSIDDGIVVSWESGDDFSQAGEIAENIASSHGQQLARVTLSGDERTSWTTELAAPSNSGDLG